MVFSGFLWVVFRCDVRYVVWCLQLSYSAVRIFVGHGSVFFSDWF